MPVKTNKDGVPAKIKKKAGRYHHGNLRAALIGAASELLENEGTQSLSLRATARLAGVSQTAPYRHFKDKGDLLACVAERGFSELTRLMEGVATASPDPRHMIPGMGAVYVQFALKNPNLLRLMFGPEIQCHDASPSLQETANASFASIQKAVTTRLGMADASAVEPLLATVGAWALVHGLSTLLLDGNLRRGLQDQNVTVEKLVNTVTGIYTRGLARA